MGFTGPGAGNITLGGPAGSGTPIVRTMTEIEGGLDEPTELEPEQGTLALAAEDDRHDRSDWEKAAAAVLRKARRLQPTRTTTPWCGRS